jgi:hypothetical protein
VRKGVDTDSDRWFNTLVNREHPAHGTTEKEHEMSASFKPQAIAPRPSTLTHVVVGQRVRIGDRVGKVVHAYQNANGDRRAWVRWESGFKGLYAVSSLMAAPGPDRCTEIWNTFRGDEVIRHRCSNPAGHDGVHAEDLR